MKDFRNDTDGGKRSRRSRFARLQQCLFLGCVAIPMRGNNNPLALSVRRRRMQNKAENYTSEPFYEQQSWTFEAIKLKYAWNLGYSGENVTIRIDDRDIWGWNQSLGDDQWLEYYKQSNSTTIRSETKNYACGLPWAETSPSNSSNVSAPDHESATVASILAANGTDKFCGVGIAPSSKVSFCTYQQANTSETIPMQRLLELESLLANITSDNSTLTYDNRTIDESNEDKDKSSFDISIHAFSYQGCSAHSKSISGVYFTPQNASIPTEPVNNNVHNLGDCPFGNFFMNEGYKSPCMVCTKEDFETVKARARDNVFETASIIKETENPYRTHRVVTEECSTSVREYCFRNFETDESLCTNWIGVINRGNVCSFESNVGIHRHHLMQQGANEGRGGKGTIYIIPSGDGYHFDDDVNYHALPKSRFAMTVGSVDMKNVTEGNNIYELQANHAKYSTTGSSIFVVAPGGDHQSSFNPIAATGEDGSCGEAGYGTAYAAPIVAGTVALMLEAYPNATWRDIRAIMVETSKPVVIKGYMRLNVDLTYGANAAKVGYSDYFGFGLINARSAVQKAKNWDRKQKHTFPEVGLTASSGKINFDIYDDSFATTISTIEVDDKRFEDGETTLESVSVYLKLRYFNRGNLKITLRSPSGTTSTLSPGGRNEYGQLNCGEWWEFLTLRLWGENPNGTWKLSITDTKSGNGGASCIDRPAGQMGLDMTCQEYELEGLCAGGVVQTLPDDMFNSMLFEQSYGRCNLNASSACCACGGGIRPDDLDMISGQLEEWKIVLGDGGNPHLDIEPIHFYDQEYWSNFNFNGTIALETNETNATEAPTRIVTLQPTMSPTEVPTQAPTSPTPFPTFQPIGTGILPDPDEEINGFAGVMNSITNFVGNLFTGGNSCDEDDLECEGGETSKVSSVFAWIITFGFSILLLIRGSSLCDLHVNFGRAARNEIEEDERRRRNRRRDSSRSRAGRSRGSSSRDSRPRSSISF